MDINAGSESEFEKSDEDETFETKHVVCLSRNSKQRCLKPFIKTENKILSIEMENTHRRPSGKRPKKEDLEESIHEASNGPVVDSRYLNSMFGLAEEQLLINDSFPVPPNTQ
ncbi:hypothetical protein TNCV_4946221 [Trichonephila clavipes]|nr:hypothetical protein TNCV_4946221 [Trichonephila clavipes]